jgi:hypothetical protein
VPDIGKDLGSIHELASFTGTESDFLGQLCEPDAFQRFLSPLRSFVTFVVKALIFNFYPLGNLGDRAILFSSAPPFLRVEI